jgi:hypothetical protein
MFVPGKGKLFYHGDLPFLCIPTLEHGNEKNTIRFLAPLEMTTLDNFRSGANYSGDRGISEIQDPHGV